MLLVLIACFSLDALGVSQIGVLDEIGKLGWERCRKFRQCDAREARVVYGDDWSGISKKEYSRVSKKECALAKKMKCRLSFPNASLKKIATRSF